MTGFGDFVEELQNALNHLNDPAYQPADSLYHLLALPVSSAGWTEALHLAIQRMAPPRGAPPAARSHRLHRILDLRYRQGLTQEVAAEQLGITARHLRREQQDAVGALARLLWQRRESQPVLPHTPAPPADEWSTQLRQELSVLQQGTSAGVCDVVETVQRVVELLAPVLEKAGVTLAREELPGGLLVAAPPTGLRQILVRAVSEWARHLTAGRIAIHAHRQGEVVAIHLAGTPAPLTQLDNDPLLQELLGQFGGSLRVTQNTDSTHLALTLAAAPPLRVLVVDDNEDLHHFYRRYVANTRYQLIALTDGNQLLRSVEESQPDVVVLDVMLPTADGWELLTQLRQHPLGRRLPVLVCSVIQEEELARALGATGYIRKPVGRRDLLHALDAATGQGNG